MRKLVPIILILASAGIFFGFVNPTYTAESGSALPAKKSVKELQALRADYATTLSKTREIELVRQALLERFNGVSGANREKISKLLPDHIDSVRLIIDINNIAALYGMSLSDISLVLPGEANGFAAAASGPAGTRQIQGSEVGSGVSAGASIGPSDRKYDSVELKFSVFGSYDNFISFLMNLERSLRLIEIVSLSFDSLGSGSGAEGAKPSDSHRYSLTIRSYYLR